jgi:hypothetical protein
MEKKERMKGNRERTLKSMRMNENTIEMKSKDKQVHSNNYCLLSIYVIYTPINNDDVWEFSADSIEKLQFFFIIHFILLHLLYSPLKIKSQMYQRVKNLL